MHELILPAKEIPVGSTVRRKRGENRFKLVESFIVYRHRRDNNDKSRPSSVEIRPESDEVLLVPESNGYANIEPNDKELVWLATPAELSEYASRETSAAFAE